MEFRGKLWKSLALGIGMLVAAETGLATAVREPYSYSAEQRTAKKSVQRKSPPAKKQPVRSQPKKQVKPVYNYNSGIDSALEAKESAYIASIRRRGTLAPTDDTSFVVYDIDHERKLVSINEDRKMMAASMIKIF